MSKLKWEVLAKKAGVNPKALPDVSMYPESLKKRAVADYKIGIIAMALNPKNRKADYSDSNEWKWYPWFRYDKALGRFVFGGSLCDDTGAIAGAGVRHTFATEELSNQAGKDFEDIYNDQLS